MYSLLEVSEPKTLIRNATSPQTKSVHYYLMNSSGLKKCVCKTFFLATLGYSKSSSVIYELLKSTPIGCPAAPLDNRGGKRDECSVDKDRITAHILTYNPSLPHYRRAHAPNRKYLPHELTIQSMLDDYNENNSKISYSSYQRVLKELNIAFTKLSTEECETCRFLSLAHEKCAGSTSCIAECNACIKETEHSLLKLEARTAYKEDAESIQEGMIVRSVDLQKVIMLPELPGVKTVCFTRRIIAFHETFAPVDEYKKK